MDSNLIPQYTGRISTSVRITQEQLEHLEHLKDATNSPNIGRAIETVVFAEHEAITEGYRKPEDFISQDKPKTCTLSVRVSTVFREYVADIKHFYHAPSMSAVVAHSIDWYTRVLESGKDSE